MEETKHYTGRSRRRRWERVKTKKPTINDIRKKYGLKAIPGGDVVLKKAQCGSREGEVGEVRNKESQPKLREKKTGSKRIRGITINLHLIDLPNRDIRIEAKEKKWQKK